MCLRLPALRVVRAAGLHEVIWLAGLASVAVVSVLAQQPLSPRG